MWFTAVEAYKHYMNVLSTAEAPVPDEATSPGKAKCFFWTAVASVVAVLSYLVVAVAAAFTPTEHHDCKCGATFHCTGWDHPIPVVVALQWKRMLLMGCNSY